MILKKNKLNIICIGGGITTTKLVVTISLTTNVHFLQWSNGKQQQQ